MALASFIASAALTGAIRRMALAQGMLDVPNSRSSHEIPTPRGGGLAIVMTVAVAFAALAYAGYLAFDMLLALSGGLAIAAVGFIDDRQGLSTRVRFSVQIGIAIWAMYWLQGMPSMRLGAETLAMGWWGYLLGALTIGWSINLFNFMDGIDGIAAAEAVFVVIGGAIVAICFGRADDFSIAAVAFGAACCGFLLWNWPRAKIFMGDIGSGFIGFVIAIFALATAARASLGLLVWAILGATFIVDASVTLITRALRGERVYEAHRSHTYQLLARRWGGHRPVTLAVIVVNVVWLLPLALFAEKQPEYAAWLTVLAFAPLVLIAVSCGAGRPDRGGN